VVVVRDPAEDLGAGLGLALIEAKVAALEAAIAAEVEEEPREALRRDSFQVPLARALMGAEEGERVDFGGKPVAIEILAVEAFQTEPLCLMVSGTTARSRKPRTIP
jgi:hypothetical protein